MLLKGKNRGIATENNNHRLQDIVLMLPTLTCRISQTKATVEENWYSSSALKYEWTKDRGEHLKIQNLFCKFLDICKLNSFLPSSVCQDLKRCQQFCNNHNQNVNGKQQTRQKGYELVLTTSLVIQSSRVAFANGFLFLSFSF